MAWALAASLCASSVASAQDSVSLSFNWPEAEAKRVITEWTFEVVQPDGKRRSTSGVIREVWRVRALDNGWAVTTSDRSIVRMGDRRDEAGMAITHQLDSAWRAEFDRELKLVSGPEIVEPLPTIEAPPAAPPEPEETPEVAVIGMDAPEAPEPVELPSVEEILAQSPLSDTELVALVVPDRPLMLERLFGTFHNQTLPVGQDQRSNVGLTTPSTGEVDQAEVVRRLESRAWCPGTGPGTDCVEVTLTRAYSGADPLAMMVDSGQRRETEAWLIEPGTMAPHQGRHETVVAREDADGRRWTYRATRTYRFLPAGPPSAPEAKAPAAP